MSVEPALPDSQTAPEQLQVLLGRVIREPALRDRVERDPDATLAELGLDEAARVAILGYGVERLLAYHFMAHARLYETISAFCGAAAKVLGPHRMHDEVRAWIDERGPKTAILRNVPEEFVAWAVPRWAADPELPPCLGPLAAHEVLKRTIRNDPRSVGEQNQIKIDLERPIACNGTARLLRYAWDLHRFPPTPEPEDAPEAGSFDLVGYRHADERPRFVQLEPRAAALLERLLAGQTLRAALFGACEALGEALDDNILASTALTLADLVDRHILLGGT